MRNVQAGNAILLRLVGLFLIFLAAAGLTTWIVSSYPKARTRAADDSPPFAAATHPTADAIYPANIGYYNVRDYGAKGDGAADDTAAIQSAMQDALAGNKQPNHGAGPRNSTVYFPSGTYLVTDTLRWAQYGDGGAQVTAQVDPSRGCITGWTLGDGGSGYGASQYGGPGLLLLGGGGSGAEAYTNISNGSVTGIKAGYGNHGTATCSGRGYTSAPQVTVLNWRAYLRFEGQNKDNTTIRLKDNTPQFANANCNVAAGAETTPRENCSAVVYTGSEIASNSTGFGEDAYMNDIWNLTIHSGSGNPGAIALDWVASNRASIKNVNLISGDGGGRCGLNVSRSNGGSGNGPGYLNNITILGFDYGIDSNAAATEVGLTAERIDLEHQNVLGVLNGDMPMWFRNVTSLNSVPAISNIRSGNLTIVDAQLLGGSIANSAILNQGGSSGLLFARNITTQGYGSALVSGGGTTKNAGYLAEYSSRPLMKISNSSNTSLALPVQETPEFVDNNFNDWADVSAYGAQPNKWTGVTAGIQAALNSGKPVVYFPYGEYITTSTLHIPGTVRKIVGANSLIRGPDGPRQQYPVFSCDSQSGNSIEIRNLVFDIYNVGYPTVLNNCSSDLILADLFNANGYTNTDSGTGNLYLENTAIPGLVTFNNQNVWARQLDIERGTSQHLVINGGKVWIFGYKTEGAGNLLSSINATVEVVGGFHSNNNLISLAPAYQLFNSVVSLAGISLYNGWPVPVLESKAHESIQPSPKAVRKNFAVAAKR